MFFFVKNLSKLIRTPNILLGLLRKIYEKKFIISIRLKNICD